MLRTAVAANAPISKSLWSRVPLTHPADTHRTQPHQTGHIKLAAAHCRRPSAKPSNHGDAHIWHSTHNVGSTSMSVWRVIAWKRGWNKCSVKPFQHQSGYCCGLMETDLSRCEKHILGSFHVAAIGSVNLPKTFQCLNGYNRSRISDWLLDMSRLRFRTVEENREGMRRGQSDLCSTLKTVSAGLYRWNFWVIYPETNMIPHVEWPCETIRSLSGGRLSYFHLSFQSKQTRASTDALE